MPNQLKIESVVMTHYRQGGRRSFGFVAFDEIACFNVLSFKDETVVPADIDGIVQHCHAEGLADVLDLLQHHADNGMSATIDGKYIPNVVLRAALKRAEALAAAA